MRNIQNLPCHQHKKNPISGEDGELHLTKVRVITQQNQEVDSVIQLDHKKRPLSFKTLPLCPYCLHVHMILKSNIVLRGRNV